jgi:hypothetical protein
MNQNNVFLQSHITKERGFSVMGWPWERKREREREREREEEEEEEDQYSNG